MFRSLRAHGDIALLLLRLAIGAIFLYHGLQKWGADSTMMQILSFVEPIAGAAILIGLFTEVAALVLSIVMLGAIYMKSTGFGQGAFDLLGSFGGQGGWEFDLMILTGCIAVLILGSGKYAVDAMMRK